MIQVLVLTSIGDFKCHPTNNYMGDISQFKSSIDLTIEFKFILV